ncbi:MAG: DNRLRE domain-containing protein, partial [Verrucomicrobia bacterium]|nr:DNRLRE domain-containing protein [Verrucomicrobiota bacterium]
MKSSAYLLLPVVCLACLPIEVAAISLELSPIADTSIFENAANKNSGKTSPLPVGKVASDKRTRLLLRFDVTGIPVGATIRSASLSVVVQKQFSASAPALQLSVYRMRTDWIEGAQGLNDLSGGEAQPGEPTWSHRKFPNVPWGTAGGQPGTDFESEASAVMRVDSTGAKVITGFCGLAHDVAAWVASPDQNHGWILSGLDGSGATSARRIASREDISNSPKLIVEFDPPSPGGYEQILARFGRIHTIAGRGAVDSNGGNDWQETFEGGPARNAELSEAHNAQADAYGNVFIADKDSHAIRVVRRDGTIHRVAGTNASGNGSDEPQPGRQCALSSPNGLHVLPNGVCYIYDTFNRKIRRLDPDGTIRTVFSDAGLGFVGRGLWVNADGSLVYYANGGDVRVWTPA